MFNKIIINNCSLNSNFEQLGSLLSSVTPSGDGDLDKRTGWSDYGDYAPVSWSKEGNRVYLHGVVSSDGSDNTVAILPEELIPDKLMRFRCISDPQVSGAGTDIGINSVGAITITLPVGDPIPAYNYLSLSGISYKVKE